MSEDENFSIALFAAFALVGATMRHPHGAPEVLAKVAVDNGEALVKELKSRGITFDPRG